MKVDIREAKIIWFFFRAFKWQCLGVIILMFITGLLDTINLAALYPIINYGLKLENKGFVIQEFDKVTKMIWAQNPFFSACVVLVLISVIAFVVKLIYNVSSNKLSIRIMGETQKRIFAKLIAADYGFYVKNQQGKLIYAGTTATEKTTVSVYSALTLAYSLINSAFLFSLLVLLSWKATCFIILLGVFYGVVVNKIVQNYINGCASVCVEENQRKNIILNEFITGIKAIKIFLIEGQWQKRHIQAVDRGLSNQFHMLVAKTFPENFVKFLFYMLIALAGICFSQRPHGEIISLLPMLGTFVIVVNRFLPSIYVIGNAMMGLAECLPDTKIVHDLCLNELFAVGEGTKLLSGFNDKITFEKIWFKYGPSQEYLLRDLSLSLDRRKMTAIVGPSGSGKTTLINLLLKLYQVDKGAIKIDGVNILDLNNKSYLGAIGYVGQETFIFNNSIKENIRFGMEDCTDRMIEEAAKLANAHQFILDSPQGYDTMVGDSGVKLSGGQKQRIAIARAMLRNPQIIVLDEATSSLDNISEKKIQKAINDISKLTTVLVIAHRLSTVQNADKIIILEHGQIIEQGTHEELLKNKKLYYQLHISKDVELNECIEEEA